MILRSRKLWSSCSMIPDEMIEGLRFYSTKSDSRLDFKKLRPMILNRIEERSKEYPVQGMLQVAREVLGARNALYDGVSTLIHHVPVWSCNLVCEFPFALKIMQGV